MQRTKSKGKIIRKLCSFSLIILFFLTGCSQDTWHIEQRGIVIGLGIDLNTEASNAREEVYNTTFQFIDPGSVAGEQGGGKDDAFYNLPIKGVNSMSDAFADVENRYQNSAYVGHTRVIVLGKTLAEQGIEKALDTFKRNSDIRRKILVYLSTDTAEDLLNIKPAQEPVNAQYLAKIRENPRRMVKFSKWVDLGTIIRTINENGTCLITVLEPGDKGALEKGAAVFKGGKLIYYLNNQERTIVELLRNNLVTGYIDTPILDENGNLEKFVFSYTDPQVRLKPVIKGNTISFAIDVELEGEIVENLSPHNKNSILKDDVSFLEEAIAINIKKDISKVIAKMKEEGQGDLLNLGRLIEIKNPKLWAQIKGDWSKMFAETDFLVNCKINIRRIGIHE